MSDLLAHGMGHELVEPDWAPLTSAEVRSVLERIGTDSAEVTVEWRSPRPFSAAALVSVGTRPGSSSAPAPPGPPRLFVKRHDRRVRDGGALSSEGRFSGYLHSAGQPVPRVLGVVEHDDLVYEVHDVAGGEDTYRDALSWTPFRTPGEAAAAGRALGELHLAAAGYIAPARPPGPLWNGTAVASAPDPVAAVADLASRLPALGDWLAGRPGWKDEIAGALGSPHRAFLPLAADLASQWTHGDWHPSNLLWTSAARGADVAGVIDFGLCNETWAIHDVATAIERFGVSWLDGPHSRTVHSGQIAEFLRSYMSVRPFDPAENAALGRLLPIVHVEYALSEIEYFHGIVSSQENALLAYEGYLLGHLAWFSSPAGQGLVAQLDDLLSVR